MGNPWGAKLSRLIRERAYVSGAVDIHERVVADLESRLAAAISVHEDFLARLKRLDVQIAQLSAINPEDIKPIRKKPRTVTGAYGSFRREMIRLLKEADGPVTIVYLAERMAEKFSMPMGTKSERRHTIEVVRKPLNLFCKREAVERLPNLPGERAGRWRWRYDYPDDDDA